MPPKLQHNLQNGNLLKEQIDVHEISDPIITALAIVPFDA